MIPSDVCSSAVRGSWSFYGNQVQVLSCFKTRGKQTKTTKLGVKLDSIPGSTSNQSLKEQNFIMWSCALKIGGGSPLPGCWMHPIPGVSNHTDLFLATGIPKWFHYLPTVDRRDECGDVLSAGSSAAVLSVLAGRRVSSGGGQTCTTCSTRFDEVVQIIPPSLCRRR